MQRHSTNEILSAVKKSGFLGKSSRQHNLLKYLLIKTELGLTEQVKAYSIALDVFKRSSNFDDSRDSIVRVEMHRLRKNLSAFNSTSKQFTLHISRASYKVEVKRKYLILKSTTIQRIFLGGVTLSLLMLLNGFWKPSSLSCSTTLPNVSITLKRDSNVTSHIVERAFSMVTAQQSSLNFVGMGSQCNTETTPSYFIQIDVLSSDNKTNILVFTSHGKLENIIHSSIIINDKISKLNDDNLFYNAVRAANDLTKTNGVISRHAVNAHWGEKISQHNYSCLAIMYDSYVSDSNKAHQTSLKCLTTSVNENNPLLDNIGGLAATYIDQARGYRAHSVDSPIQEATRLMDEVGDNWINGVETTITKIFLEVESSTFNSEQLKNILNVAKTHYPLNPHVLIPISGAYGPTLGNWEEAKRLSDLVKLIHSDRDNSVLLIDASYALMNMTPKKSINECVMANSENSILSNLIIYACANIAQNEIWMEKTKINLKKLGFSTSEAMITYIKSRNFEPNFTSKFIKGLQKKR